jgi:formate dehydrogenase subunit delta
MNVEHLCEMANDIGAFFAAEPEHEAAVSGIVNHIRRFWEPRMRKQIVGLLEGGETGLDPLVREAVQRLAQEA